LSWSCENKTRGWLRKSLRRRLEEKERSSKRQATPFSKGEKKANPKKPGWKPGEGKFSRRDLPTEEEITHRVQVPLQGDRCPFCSSSNLGEVRIERAFCTDISESPKPQVTAYSLEVRKCLNCGRTLLDLHAKIMLYKEKTGILGVHPFPKPNSERLYALLRLIYRPRKSLS